jgi:hypothetical protein
MLGSFQLMEIGVYLDVDFVYFVKKRRRSW